MEIDFKSRRGTITKLSRNVQIKNNSGVKIKDYFTADDED